jgi:hypothetical protein
MRRWWQGILAVILAGCSALPKDVEIEPVLAPGRMATPLPDEPYRASLDDLGPAPELNNEVWLNSEEALRLEDLHGKVVLIDMWTFG